MTISLATLLALIRMCYSCLLLFEQVSRHVMVLTCMHSANRHHN